MIEAFRALDRWCSKHKLPLPTVTLSFDNAAARDRAATLLWSDIDSLRILNLPSGDRPIRDGTLFGIGLRLVHEGELEAALQQRVEYYQQDASAAWDQCEVRRLEAVALQQRVEELERVLANASSRW